MFSSFQTALSALDATSTAIDVTGNNLANLNTTGFKDSRVSFLDLISQSIGAASRTQVGLGVTTPHTNRQFTQGAIQNTSGPLDAAIQGDGFFVVVSPSGQQLLTRAGSFQTDAAGTLMSPTGEKVQGWTQLNADGTVNTNGPIGNIQLPTGSLRQPFATQNFGLNMNLDASAAVGSASASFSAPIQVIDSLGNTQNLTINLTKTANNAWSYTVTIPSSALTTPSATPLATGNLKFDSSGNLTSPAPAPPATTNQITVKVTGLADGAADMNMNWNLSDPTTGVSSITQIAQPSAVSTSTQDGTAAAQLSKVSIGDGGVIVAQYSNGQIKNVGELALASIRNPDSLIAVGNNNLEISSITATPVIGAPRTGGRGDILGGSLESSNVDIATEFTNLIVYQRGYQANAKVINTEDQLTQDTISLKQ